MNHDSSSRSSADQIMTILNASLILLLAFTVAQAATACKRDACYSAVAANGPSKPNVASRKADCAAIFKTVLDNVFTSTSTRVVETLVFTTQTVTTFDRTSTLTGSETTTFTVTTIAAQKRDIVEIEGGRGLMERDTVYHRRTLVKVP